MARVVSKENYIFKTFKGMSYGFFMSMALGTILKQIGYVIHFQDLVTLGQLCCYLMGPMIGICMAYAIETRGLSLVCAIFAGTIGAGTISGATIQVGNPIMAYLAVLLSVFIVRVLEDKTPFDIFLIPMFSLLCASLLSRFVSGYVTYALQYIGYMINQCTSLHPLLVGMLVALIMGLLTTSPFTSMTIGMMLGLKGIAAGAALAGCCAHMLGLAIMSIDDNSLGDVLAIGIGTSMFQFTNILRRPLICIPPIISSILSGMLSAGLIGLKCTTTGSWIGTTGLLGLFECIKVMGSQYWLPLIIIDVLLPLCLCWSMYRAFRKLNYIKSGDMKINKL